MKSLEESIARSMDCEELGVLPFLSFILQDFDEIGSLSETIIELIRKHQNSYSELRVLDLGCGKGAVSIKVVNEFNCRCLGIDGISDFINEAKEKAEKCNISDFCKFEVNDIRERILTLPKFDVIILGSIGDVFGNYNETLSIVSEKLNENGIIIIDDGYISEEAETIDTQLEKREMIVDCGKKLKVPLVDEIILTEKNIQYKEYDKEFTFIKRRCTELIEKYPSKSKLFQEFVKKQKEEYEVLKNDFIGSTMVFKK